MGSEMCIRDRLLLYATPPCSAVRSASAQSAASARSAATVCRALVICHSYVQTFDLPVVDLLPFDLLRPDLLPPCVVLLFRLHLLHISALVGRRTTFILHDDLKFIAPPPFTKDIRVWYF